MCNYAKCYAAGRDITNQSGRAEDNTSILRPCLLSELERDRMCSRPRLIVFCRGCRHFRLTNIDSTARQTDSRAERSSTQRLPDYFYFDCESF